jgi:hypothetical protein
MSKPFDEARLQEVLDVASDFTRKTAMSIMALPPEARGTAIELTERAMKASIFEMLGDAPIGEKWLQSNMAAIRGLIAQIELSGGADGGSA